MQAGFVPATQTTQQYDETVPAGNVIETIPAKGQPVQRGSTIVLTISEGASPPPPPPETTPVETPTVPDETPQETPGTPSASPTG